MVAKCNHWCLIYSVILHDYKKITLEEIRNTTINIKINVNITIINSLSLPLSVCVTIKNTCIGTK